MKTVLSTTDHSLVESLRLALAAEGIPVTVLVQDADYDRARAIATNLEEGTA